MSLELLLNPLTVYGVAIVAVLLSLTLFVGVKREMAKARGMAQKSQTSGESDQLVVRTLESEIETLRESVRHLEAVPANRASIGINLTKRTKALRMHHRGESIPSIAAALETPTNEVALLLKVHAMTNGLQKKAS